MADPATQFQAAGLNVPYSFQPTVANLGGSHLFGGAGELWAQVGTTAMNAANMLQRSALNPQVRAQMQEAVQRAHLGTQVTKWVQAHPHWAHAVTAETPEGATTVAPITQPVAQQAAEGIDWNQDGDQQQKQQQQQQQQPTITRTGTNTGVDQNGKQYHETTAGSNQWIAGKPSPIPPTNLNAGMAQGGLVRGYAAGGVTDKSGGSSDSADRDALIGRMIAERQAAGIPDTFQPQPPAQLHPAVQPQGGSIWTPQRPSPVAPPPAPAPAPAQAAPQPGQGPQMTLGATAQPPPGMELAGTEQAFPQRPSQQDQAALASWQARNAHPVMASSDALDWAKLFDTGVQRATYLQHGGPNGEPAYAFHMKGGGINTVPISQIVKNGGAASVAGQNTSATLSASDALMNQPPGQEPGMTLGATAQPPPGMQLGQPQPGQAQQAGPPAAPGPITPMPSGTGAGAAQGVPAASTAYNPAAYQMPQGPTITQTGEVNPALMAGGSDKQAAAAAAAKAAAKPGTGTEVDVSTPPDQVAKMNADAASNNPNLDWKKDENGKKYIGNQDPQHPFWEQRFYPLSGGFQTGPWTAENIRKQQLLEEFAGPGGVPLPMDEKTGKKVVLDKDTIDGLSPEDQNKWLEYARNYKLHTKYPLPTSDEGQNLANAANAIQAAQRIKDKILYLKANNIPMDAISQDELIRSQEAGWAKSSPVPWAALAMGGPPNNFADELRGDYRNLNLYLSKVHGGHYPDAATPKPEDWGTPAIGDWLPAMGIPRGTSVSTIPTIARISAGDNYDQALAHIQEVLDNATTDYKNAAKGLPKGEYRLPDVDQKNLYDLDNKGKGYIDDPTNLIWDKNHQKMVNGYGTVPYLSDKGWQTGGGQAKSSPTPVPLEVANAAPRPKTRDAYNAIPKGTLFWDTDGKLKPHP